MKSLRMLAIAGFAALALASCSTLQGLSTSSPAQATTAAAAELAYTSAAQLEKVWLESGKATKAQAKVAKALDSAVYADVVAAREAVAANDSPAVAVALKLFNQALPELTGYVANNGGASVK